jgi:uncharacterized membrane protein
MKWINLEWHEIALWLVGGLTVFMLPIWQYFLAMVVFIFGDILTRVLVVRKTSGWKAVRSNRLYDSVPKLIAYGSAIICFHAMEVFIDDTVPLTKLVCYFIGSVELKSIAENIDELTGINLFEFIKEIFARKKHAIKPTDKPPTK